MALRPGYIDDLIYRCDIVDVISSYLPLKRAGGNHVGLCPFHSEKTPSFSVSRDKQIFKCFGCGEGGNVISFVMKMENLPFFEAVTILAERYGMEPPEDDRQSTDVRKWRKRLAELNRDAAHFYHETLMSPGGEQARKYLQSRAISPKMWKTFGLGYADDSWDGLIAAMHEKGYSDAELDSARLVGKGKSGGLYCFFRSRLIFPVIGVRGDVVAFGGRVMQGSGDGRKYINSPDTLLYNKSQTLYGMNIAKGTKRQYFILCEGNVDVIALHQGGFDCAVASCGTAFTAQQARLMAKYDKELIICYDSDAAGKNATQKAIGIAKAAGMSVRVLKLPEERDSEGNVLKLDPDEYIKRHGREKFEKLLENPESDGEYRLNELLSQHNMHEDSERVAFLKESAVMLAQMDSDVEREVYSRIAARHAGISEESMFAEVKRTRNGMIKSRRQQAERRELMPKNNVQPKTAKIRYTNPVSAKSEEMLISAMMNDQSVLTDISGKIESDDFSSDFLAKIFMEIMQRNDDGLAVTPALVMSALSEAEANVVADIAQRYAVSSDLKSVVNDCIDNIRFQKAKSGSDEDILARAIQRKRRKDNERTGSS